MAEQRNEDRELTQTATRELLELPAAMRDMEVALAGFTSDARLVKSELEDAELSAQINCTADAKNAEGRKLQLESAVANDGQVLALRGRLAGLETQRATAEADFNDLHRRFRAALAIAELQTAKINYRTKFDAIKAH